MAASETDYFVKVGSPGTATTMTAPGHTIGGTSISVVSTANYPTETGVIFAIDTVTIVNGKEVRDVGSYTEWQGTVGGATTLENMVLRYGTDQNYPAGSTTRVYIPVSSSRENRLVDGLLVSHDQDGTLKAGAVDNAACLSSGIVDNTKLNTTAGDIGGAWKSFNINPQGFSSLTASSGFYTLIGKTCHMRVNITGTSNSTTFSFSLPFAVNYVVDVPVRIQNNSGELTYGLLELAGYTGYVYLTAAGGAFTNTGTKRLISALFTFEIQ